VVEPKVALFAFRATGSVVPPFTFHRR
jgi:hypothetical protein